MQIEVQRLLPVLYNGVKWTIILARALDITGNTNTDDDLTPMHVRTNMTKTHGT